jgi:hypothetical protein
MSNGKGPPPIFEGDGWKIRMEVYLEAIDVMCLRAVTEGLPKIKDPANPVGDEKYDRWNAKAKNALYRGLGKDIFNRVRNAKKMHMNCGKTFVLSMRELRVSMRNAIILL